MNKPNILEKRNLTCLMEFININRVQALHCGKQNPNALFRNIPSQNLDYLFY